MSGLQTLSDVLEAHTPWHGDLILVNAVLSTVIVYQLMFFRRDGSRHKAWAGWVAWLLIGVEASFPVRLLMGQPVEMDWGHLALNILLCASLVAVEGNVAQLFRRTHRLVDHHSIKDDPRKRYR